MINTTRYDEALASAYSYTEYRCEVSNLFLNNKSTGTNHSEDYLNYTNMNIRRMDRLDKKAIISPETIQAIESIYTPMTWLTLTEGWCADAAQCLPYIAKMANLNDRIDLKLILRDDNLDIMDAHLFNGTQSIPKVIILNTETLEILGEWGPRPVDAQQIVDQSKADIAQSNDGAIKALIDYEKNKALQLWYKKDKGVGVQKEMMVAISLFG